MRHKNKAKLSLLWKISILFQMKKIYDSAVISERDFRKFDNSSSSHFLHKIPKNVYPLKFFVKMLSSQSFLAELYSVLTTSKIIFEQKIRQHWTETENHKTVL